MFVCMYMYTNLCMHYKCLNQRWNHTKESLLMERQNTRTTFHVLATFLSKHYSRPHVSSMNLHFFFVCCCSAYLETARLSKILNPMSSSRRRGTFPNGCRARYLSSFCPLVVRSIGISSNSRRCRRGKDGRRVCIISVHVLL